MTTIVVDAMGGDLGHVAVVQAMSWLSKNTEGSILMVGDNNVLAAELDKHDHDPSKLEIIASEGAIPMDAKPRKALEELPRASLPLAAQMVASGDAHAFVSAGNTGAVVLSCSQAFKRLPKIRRTALAAVYPTEMEHGKKHDPFSLMLDVGANIRVGAEDLEYFGVMGAAYASVVSDNPRPTIALLNNGTECTKGPPEFVEAYQRLAARTDLDFIGNVEGLDIPRGTADVVVCDGFTGNVVLKMLEGVNETVKRLARYAYRSAFSWKLALMLLNSAIKQLKQVTDWRQYGGAPILGFEQLCIKAHGRSTARAISNAVKVARKAVDSNLTEKIAHQLESH